MIEAALTAALIAAGGLAPPHPAGLAATVPGAVDLAPVAMTADQHLLTAEGAQEEAGACVIAEVALALGASVNSWTRSASGAIMPLQSCSGTVWGAAPS
jgi:hypothetical protein